MAADTAVFSWPVPELLTPAADRSRRRLSQRISGCSNASAGQPPSMRGGSKGQSADQFGEYGEFGMFLAAEFASLQSRVLARLEQDLAGGDVQRLYSNRASSRKTSLIGARQESIDDVSPGTARWGRLVTALIEADENENVRLSRVTSRGSDPDEELWTPHPDWQSMTLQDPLRRSETDRPTRSMLVHRMFVDQLQTTYCGAENGGIGMVEKSGNSWLSRHVMHPDGARAICWCFVGLMLMCYETVTIPLEAAGLNEKPSTALAVAILVYWMLDLPHHALTGYMHDVTLEMRPSYTLRHYAKTWMAIDLALVSGDLAFLILDTRGTAQTLKLLRLMRMARLVRIRRWNRTFKALMIGRQYEKMELILRLAGLVLSLLVVCHLLACTWYHLGAELPSGDGWLDDGNLRSESNRLKYAAAFHWTITQFTPSTNNIGPQTTEERCFAIAVVIMGMVVFSTFLDSLSNTVDEMRSYGSNSTLVQERHRLLVFTKQRGLTHVISQKILAFFDTEKTRESHVVTEADLPVVAQLPKAVQMGLRAELYLPYLRRHPLFSVIASHDATFCINLCFKTMSEERCMAQQVVFVDGVQSDMTYIARSGLVEYVYQSGVDFSRVSFSVTSGSWLAECALWVKWTHQGLLLAHSSASLVTMDCAAMRSLVEMHSPDLRAMLKCFAILFAHEMDINGRLATDLAPPTDFLERLTQRAASFAASQFPNLPSGVAMAGRAATPPASDGNSGLNHMVSKLRSSVFAV